MKIRDIAEAEEVLRSYVPARDHISREDIILDRIKNLMKAIGNPERKLKAVHIAGTSGKTSTAYYMAALLTAAGKKVGTTVSPHVDSITERLQINGQPISKELFCSELEIFIDEAAKADHRPTYFELLYAFTIWVMVRQKVDYAVVETGVGGLYDATNILEREDKICIITDIGFDHMHLLGETLGEIAAQKAGISHKGNQVFMYQQAEEVMEAVEQVVSENHAQLNLAEEPETSLQAEDIPDYQFRNWFLAYGTYQYLAERDGLQYLTRQVLLKTQSTSVPGRMESKIVNGKTVVMDGAHNGQKMTAFVDSFKKLYPDVKPAILLSVKTGKEYEKLVPILAPLASRIITTSYTAMQDLKINAMPPEELAQAFEGKVSAEALPDQDVALKKLLSGPEEICIITGSFYFLGQIRNSKLLA